MKMSTQGRAVLTRLEGKRNKPYQDVAGFWTIGVGHLVTRSEFMSGKIQGAKWKNGITDQQINDLFTHDLQRTEVAITDACSKLSQCQFDALVSFAFNVGAKAFANSTLLKRIRAGELADVPHQLKRWNIAGGRVVQGLTNRRTIEVKMWWEGEYV